MRWVPPQKKLCMQGAGYAVVRFMSTGGDYDVAVIGGGPGGYVAAIKAAQLGLKTVSPPSCVPL